ncbi:MAG: TetR/AcrR family transcriptional regulator [Firmicutes bacterium]|nr:TetR/AcrR family transcriptional regulator [Bacillota bacterium]
MNGNPEKINSRDIQAMERRKQLLEAAEDLFYEFGYHATTVRMINRKIGMADGLIYHYFPDGKKELLETIIREGGARFLSRFEPLNDSSYLDMPLKEALFKFCIHAYESHISELKWASIIIKERNILKDNQVEILNDIYKDRSGWLKNFIEKNNKWGEIGKVDLDIFVWQVTSVIYLALLDRITGINFADSNYKAYFKRMIDSMVELWNK